MTSTRHGKPRIARIWLWGALIACVVAVAAAVVIRQFTKPAFIEKQLAAALGANYRIHIGRSSFNPFSRNFSAYEISITPDTTSQVVREGQLRMRYSFVADAVRVNRVDLWALSKKRIAVACIEVDKPLATIYLDRHIPGPKPAPATLPHEILNEVERPIRVDTIRITDGNLRYSERAVDGSRPGTFEFADLNAMITGVTNDTTRMNNPCVIDVRARLANAGQLDANFEYDFRSDALNMRYHATVGRMGGLSLNELLVDLEGIRVTGGTIDTTSFAIDVKDDVATGTLRVLFTDITFEMIDKNSLEKGLAERFGTFIYRQKARESNPEDDKPAIEITLHRRREPNVPLIKFVWETVREGLLRTLGVQ